LLASLKWLLQLNGAFKAFYFTLNRSGYFLKVDQQKTIPPKNVSSSTIEQLASKKTNDQKIDNNFVKIAIQTGKIDKI
jgi:hypothetical protein